MADRADIERVAKILARANSDSEGEAETALNSAYSRMKRDGVTLSDLLSLPETTLYQDALVRLAELIVKNQGELSHSAKRELYAAYLKRIVEKFSGARSSGGGDSSKGEQQTKEDRERDEAAKEYERRRQEEEARRRQSRTPPPPEPPRPPPRAQSENPFKRQNVKTEQDGVTLPFRYDPDRFPLDFSVGAFFSFFFGANSYIGSIYSYPSLAFALFFRSLVVGGITFGVLFWVFVFIVKNVQFAPLLYMAFLFFWNIALTAFLFVFVTSYIFYERGWYPRGPRVGETDFLSIAKSLWRLTLALLWRAYGVWAWLSNRAYIVGYRWQTNRKNKH